MISLATPPDDFINTTILILWSRALSLIYGGDDAYFRFTPNRVIRIKASFLAITPLSTGDIHGFSTLCNGMPRAMMLLLSMPVPLRQSRFVLRPMP